MNVPRFLTKRSLSRRTFLRGAGTALALPLLDAMIRRGRLDVPVIGVAKPDWTVEQLRERARQSIAATEGGRFDATAAEIAQMKRRAFLIDGAHIFVISGV